MSIYIKVNNTEYPATVDGNRTDRSWGDRDTKTIHLTMTHDEAAALLPDNTPWSIVQRDTVPKYDSDGKPTGETEEVVNEYDNSEYSLSGAITDHRDGTVSIKMGKHTESEKSSYTVEALMGESITPQRAIELRPMIEQAAKSFTDAEAAKSPELVARWKDHIGEVVEPGDRMSDTDDNSILHVYRVNDGHGHTTQADWPPHSTPAMWTIIDIEHAGTQNDPIPAARGMEYTYGLYYKDPEDTKLYLCERTGEQSGNKITLQYLPHELVGNYFTAV